MGPETAAAHVSRPTAGSIAAALLPLMAVVVVAYLVTGIAMPVLPVYVHQGLGLGTFAVGVMESFVITGALSWGVALAGSQNTGKVMSWVGTALYTAFAVGAPLGTGLYAAYGFAAIGFATMLLPLATVGVVAPLRPIKPAAHVRPAFRDVVRAIWVPGVALALSGVGFAAIITFVPLLFVDRGWGEAWIPLTAFSAAFMVARVAFGHVPDRMGGVRVALFCMLIEAAGLALIWRASGSTAALVGVTLTGLGYSLVYPGLGVEAVRLAPPQSRGVAMGTYTAFLDLSLGLASPSLGWLADAGGLSLVFLVSGVVVAGTAALGTVAVRWRWPVRRGAESQMSPTRARA